MTSNVIKLENALIRKTARADLLGDRVAQQAQDIMATINLMSLMLNPDKEIERLIQELTNMLEKYLQQAVDLGKKSAIEIEMASK